MTQNFIPATMEREIAKDIVFRPIKSWHSNTYAGEKEEHLPNETDRSGCARKIDGLWYCPIPLSVTHRKYWHRKNPKYTISAFLSYPNGLGAVDKYFWEALGTINKYEERFFSEEEMERKIIKKLKYEYKKLKR